MALVSTTNKKEIAYIAGFIDGEGCLTLSLCKNRNRLSFNARLIIVNCDKNIIEWMVKKIGGSYRTKQQPKANHKLSYHLCLGDNHKLLKFLNIITPYLRIKRKQAKIIKKILILRIRNFRKRNRDKIRKHEMKAVKAIQELNKKGC